MKKINIKNTFFGVYNIKDKCFYYYPRILCDATETGYIIEYYGDYNENGYRESELKKYAEYFRLNGKKEGKYLRYDKKGNIITESNYVNGKLHGNFKEFDYKRYDDVRCIRDVMYCNGKIISIL